MFSKESKCPVCISKNFVTWPTKHGQGAGSSSGGRIQRELWPLGILGLPCTTAKSLSVCKAGQRNHKPTTNHNSIPNGSLPVNQDNYTPHQP